MSTPRFFLGLLLSVSVFSVSHAQIVITAGDILSSVPGSFITNTYHNPCTPFRGGLACDDQAGIQALLDTNGASQTWDFTTLTWLDSFGAVPVEYLDMPAGLPADNDPRLANATYARIVADPFAIDRFEAGYFSTSPTEHLNYGTYGQLGGGGS